MIYLLNSKGLSVSRLCSLLAAYMLVGVLYPV